MKIGKKYGYVRVSSKSQESNSSIESQKDQLIQNGIQAKNIRVEVGSGANEIRNRPIFQKLIEEELKPNDLLMVTKIDRCSRNTLEFLKLQDILFKKNITFVALDLPTSVDLATNKLIATTLSGIAEFENNRRKERKKRSGKKRRIFASAVLAGNLLFSNLKTNDLKTQNYSNATTLTHEKVITNQELNSFDGFHNSGQIIRTGNGTILESQQQVSDASLNEILSEQNSNKPDEVILVKDGGILPGAEAFPPPFPKRYGYRTTNGMGGSNPGSNSAPSSGNLDGNCRSNPTPRFPHQLSSNHQNQNKKKKKNSQQVSEQKVIEAYQNFISEMNHKGYEVNISEDRFIELSKNPQTGKFDKKSIFETEGGLQGEVEGLYSNLRRTRNPEVDLDFEATSMKTGQTIFVDHKGMIDFGSLSDKGINTSGFPSHESIAFNMGKDSADQKGRFVGLDKGPKSRSDVLHLYNFKNIRNNAEIPFLVQAVLNGAEQAGYTDGIRFINYK